MPVSPTLRLGLQTLEQAIQLTPATPVLAAILTNAQNILQRVDADQSGHQDEERLAQKVLDIAIVYSDGVKKLQENGCKDVGVERVSDNLSRCLESISNGLLNKPKARLLERMLTQSAAQKRLKDWEADLDRISSTVETQIRFRSAQLSQALSLEPDREASLEPMAERMLQANQEVFDLIQSGVLNQTRKKLHRSSFGHFPPSASAIFFGRSHQVEHLVKSLLKVPAYHAILGPGGMGKTSVALNMLHDPRIVEVYGKHRCFLACETTTDAKGIIAGLADIFSLNEGSFVKSFKSLCEVIKSNILFLLDNFETPWERQEARQKVEDLLADLSRIQNLSIVITLRGAERPHGIIWSRPCLPVLEPLEPSAARQTFLAISDVSNDDVGIDSLLEEVEFIPLAITLLAAQAQYMSCTSLLKQWQISKTSMISRGWNDRLSSLDVSISLSLTSCRFISNPSALSLLQVLSLLPDGATIEELHVMTAGHFDIYKSVSTLLQVALANTGQHERVRVLAPIREYMQSNRPISDTLLHAVFSYHAELSRYAMSSQWTEERLNMDDKLRICIGNIHHVIRYSFNVEALTNEAIKATVNVATYRRESYSGSISHLLERSVDIAREFQKPVLLAACLQEIGHRMMWFSLSDRLRATGYLEESVNILRSHSIAESADLLTTALTTLSWNLDHVGSHKGALKFAHEAVDLISPSTDAVISALAYMRLGTSLMDDGNYTDCRKALELARSYFQPAASQVLKSKLANLFGLMFRNRAMYNSSIKSLDVGLRLHNLAGSERAELLLTRGTMCLATCRYEDARSDLRECIQCLSTWGMAAFISVAYFYIGMTYVACGNFTDAALNISGASQLGYLLPHDNPNLAFAMMELYQNHLDQSLLYLRSASKEIALIQGTSRPGVYELQILCQIQIRQRHGEEATSACILIAVIAHQAQGRIPIALSMLWLGDAFFFVHKSVSAASACYQYSHDLVRYLGNRRWIASGLLRIAVADYLRGDLSLAHRRLNQAASFYEETDGKMWAQFCKRLSWLMDGGVLHENIPYFPPVTLEYF